MIAIQHLIWLVAHLERHAATICFSVLLQLDRQKARTGTIQRAHVYVVQLVRWAQIHKFPCHFSRMVDSLCVVLQPLFGCFDA